MDPEHDTSGRVIFFDTPFSGASLPGDSVEGCLCEGNYDAVTSRSAYEGCIQEPLSSHLVTQFR